MSWAERHDPPSPTTPGRLPRDGESVISPSHICCGQRLRRHAVEPTESGLSFTYCGRCESLQWLRADVPVTNEPTTLERMAGLSADAAQGMAAQRPGTGTSR